MKGQFKNVFIGYANEDYSAAERIYNFLLQKEYTPWLDKKSLKTGANWDHEINKVLKQADFIIFTLSSTSVKKRGYVQREIKCALDYAKNKLVDDIYIIPVLLDECDVPDELSRFQWIKIDSEELEDKIFESMEYQRKRYFNDLPSSKKSFSDYTSFSIDPGNLFPAQTQYSCIVITNSIQTLVEAQ